ncbi:MAG: 1-phosphofructokinase, partial [Lachnospiraceae bacterium]|nr:1-phosphofructokinase [Lachnospiraceae bacterium]
MIATVSLNPAIDKTITMPSITIGDVNRVNGVVNIAGGKGVNVAKVLRQYDYEVKTLGFAGGYTGEMIANTVRHLGAEDAFTFIKGETRTSMNLVTEDGNVTELLEPGPRIIPSELK